MPNARCQNFDVRVLELIPFAYKVYCIISCILTYVAKICIGRRSFFLWLDARWPSASGYHWSCETDDQRADFVNIISGIVTELQG